MQQRVLSDALELTVGSGDLAQPSQQDSASPTAASPTANSPPVRRVRPAGQTKPAARHGVLLVALKHCKTLKFTFRYSDCSFLLNMFKFMATAHSVINLKGGVV